MAAKKKATAKAAKKAGQTPGKTEKTEKKKAESKAVEKKAPAKKTTVKETAKSKASAGTKESGKSVRGKAKNEQKVAPKAGFTVNLKPAKPALVAAPGVKITRKDNTRKNTERQNEVCKLTKKEIKDLQDDLLERRDVVIIASVSCIYGLGSPQDYEAVCLRLETGGDYDRKIGIKLMDRPESLFPPHTRHGNVHDYNIRF